MSGWAVHGGVRQGEAGQCVAWPGNVRRGTVRPGEVLLGQARQGVELHGRARLGKVL